MVVDKQAMQTKRAWAKKPPEDWAYEFLIERYQHLLRRRQELGIVVGDGAGGGQAGAFRVDASVGAPRHARQRQAGRVQGVAALR